jgi:hypothetical protein
MEETYSSEPSVDFQWIILRYIPEEKTLKNVRGLGGTRNHRGNYFLNIQEE